MTTCFQGFRPLVSGSLFISILTWTNCSKASRASSSSWLFYCFLGIILSFFITFFSSFNVQFPSKSQIHFVLFWKDHGSSSLTPEHPQTSPYLTVLRQSWLREGAVHTLERGHSWEPRLRFTQPFRKHSGTCCTYNHSFVLSRLLGKALGKGRGQRHQQSLLECSATQARDSSSPELCSAWACSRPWLHLGLFIWSVLLV